MIIPMFMAQVIESHVAPSQVTAVAHDYTCQMRTADNRAINLVGKTRVRMFAENNRALLSLDVRSTDKKWRFLSGAADAGFTPGPLYMKVAILLDDRVNLFDDRKGGASEYALELTFPSQAVELHGAYGFAVLRNTNDDTPLILENRPDPIVAIGPCNVTPAAKASQ